MRGEAGQVTLIPQREAANGHFNSIREAEKSGFLARIDFTINPSLGLLL